VSGKYRTIVADPPWHVGAGPDWASSGPSRKLVYPTMTFEDICAMPVKDLAADNAHLYIWTINAYLERTYDLARAWGFKPSTMLTWAKRPNGIGLGGTYSLTTEFILFARRGTCKALSRVDSTWWEWPRGRHSAKPEAFLDMVEQVSPGPYVELFARRNRLGWDTWGNESLNTAEWPEVAA
jgi:N6-adenosine-specific RNA methylase IME4